MADATSRKLLQLLTADHDGELRRAAAMVLAEVGTKDAQLAQALCAAVDDPDPPFRARVLRAIGKLRVARALPRLLALVAEGGPDTAAAAAAAACLGNPGTKALRDMMAEASPVLRRRIAAALGAGGTASAETAAVDALLDEDPGVVDAATRSLIAQVAAVGSEHRRALADHVLALLKAKRRLRPASEAALLRLLAALGDSRGEAAFWARVDAKNPPELRAAALQALGSLPVPSARDRVQRLLDCAASPEFRVAAPALMILRTVPVGERLWQDWLPLLDAPDPAARRFAIDKLQGRDTQAFASALVRQLKQPDRSLREQALACLSVLEQGRKALVGELLEVESAEEAWVLARAQAPFAPNYAASLRSEIFARACRYLEA
ncbi:MAG TPA: HEAT repeat domain-containing protein, partial [Gemmataceae bacterium]|nr:HEAT repeat domain-containing protein [Gemmataceae bacterium]